MPAFLRHDARYVLRARRVLATLACAVAAVLTVSGGCAWGETLVFRSTAPSEPADAGSTFTTAGGLPLAAATREGAEGTLTFRQSKADERAVKTQKSADALRAERDRAIAAGNLAQSRADKLQQLLDEAQGDEAVLRAEIDARLVARYKGGDTGGLNFLLDSSGLEDLVTRGSVLKQGDAQLQRQLADYQLNVQNIVMYQQALEALSTYNGDRAVRLDKRASDLDATVIAAHMGHDEAPDELTASAKSTLKKQASGTWYVMDGAFTAQLYLPLPSGGANHYDGGTTTFPARRATPQEIAIVLGDSRIELDASGRGDIASGQIDGRLLDAMSAAAGAFGHIRITSLKSDHPFYTASGNVSEHSYGCAMDIGTIGSTYIDTSSQVAGGEVERAVRFFMNLGATSGRPDLAPHQVISLFDLGGSSLRLADHHDHIHVGYHC